MMATTIFIRATPYDRDSLAALDAAAALGFERLLRHGMEY
jgi:hypothetical protein